MPDTLPVPEWASENEADTIERLNRNGRIRRGFKRLRAQGKSKTLAYEILAQQEECHPAHICKVVKGER